MEELIKEAEKLYKDIDETQSHLIKARLNKDRIREHLELIGLETIVFDVKQLLKCIIDRKDNIVDLGEVWHNNKDIPHKDRTEYADLSQLWHYKDHKPPEIGRYILADTPQCGILLMFTHTREFADKFGNYRYAYIDDLLPKGGKAWNTTK